MSTRKIDVWIGDISRSRFTVAHKIHGEVEPFHARPATLIIGGKGYTVEEVKEIIETVKAEAVAAVNAMSNWHNGQRSQPPPPVAYVIDKAVELKHGITP